jgi:predicted nucleotidyltransferase
MLTITSLETAGSGSCAVRTHPGVADIGALTRLMLDKGIEFILVGGAAAVAHGSPTSTRDYDVVHSRSAANIQRLIALVGELDAYFRTDLSGRHIVPGAEHFAGHGQILLATSLGPLDFLCELHDGRGFDELLPHTVILDADGRDLRVLDLPTLIEVKTAAGRPKDKIVVAELLAILDRKTRT